MITNIDTGLGCADCFQTCKDGLGIVDNNDPAIYGPVNGAYVTLSAFQQWQSATYASQMAEAQRLNALAAQLAAQKAADGAAQLAAQSQRDAAAKALADAQAAAAEQKRRADAKAAADAAALIVANQKAQQSNVPITPVQQPVSTVQADSPSPISTVVSVVSNPTHVVETIGNAVSSVVPIGTSTELGWGVIGIAGLLAFWFLKGRSS